MQKQEAKSMMQNEKQTWPGQIGEVLADSNEKRVGLVGLDEIKENSLEMCCEKTFQL